MAASFSSWEVHSLLRKHGLWTAQEKCSQNLQSKQPGRVRASIRHRGKPELQSPLNTACLKMRMAFQINLSQRCPKCPSSLPILPASICILGEWKKGWKHGSLDTACCFSFVIFNFTSSWKMSMSSQCMSIIICSSSIRETLISVCS